MTPLTIELSKTERATVLLVSDDQGARIRVIGDAGESVQELDSEMCELLRLVADRHGR